MLDKNLLTTDIGIDLGTSSVLVYVKGKGIVLCEPCVVAMDTRTGDIVKIGRAAQQMLGRAPENIEIIRPLKDGVISQYSVTLKMIRYFIEKACGRTLIRPRVMICVPSGIDEKDEMTVINATQQAGARQTLLIEEPVAAALGAGIDINAPEGRMIVDIGGGTTDVAVISYGGVVVSRSIRVAGNALDNAIMTYIKKKHRMLVGESSAEMIKIKASNVSSSGTKAPTVIKVKGKTLGQGLPKVVEFSSAESLEAMLEPLTAILDTICLIIQQTPPELLSDICKNGIVLTGGGAKLRGLDKLIETTTNIRTYVAKDPISCVVMGTGKSIEELDGGVLDFLGSFGNS